MTQDLLRTPKAAARIGLPPGTLERLRAEGIGPPYFKFGKKLVCYAVSDLEAWLANRRMAAEVSAAASSVEKIEPQAA